MAVDNVQIMLETEPQTVDSALVNITPADEEKSKVPRLVPVIEIVDPLDDLEFTGLDDDTSGIE